VVPVTADGQIVLIRQYRYPIDEWRWELPAGGLHDHDGSLEALARKELAQEIGASCDEFTYVTWFYGPTSSVSEVCHVLLARGVRLDGATAHEETESIEIHPLPIEQALALARSGAMKDGQSALVLLLCEPYLKEMLHG
jgi:ADP-ribose pyrophosphatase